MKSLLKPPIQSLLWLASLSCIGLAAWNLWQLRELSEQQTHAASVSIQLPDAAALQVPELASYTRLVESPLFWESRTRKSDAPAVAVVAEPIAPPAELPKGRLVGIVNTGKKSYGLVRGEEKNISLHKGDKWEGWTVEAIEKDRLKLVAGDQKQEVRLLAEFSAPKENEQLAKAKQQKAKPAALPVAAANPAPAALPAQLNQQTIDNVAKSLPAEVAANVLLPLLQQENTAEKPADTNAAGNNKAATNTPKAAGAETKPAELAADSAMSLQAALEARQKLMAARWGAAANQ